MPARQPSHFVNKIICMIAVLGREGIASSSRPREKGIRVVRRRQMGGKPGVEGILASRPTDHPLDDFLSLSLSYFCRVVWPRSRDIQQDNLDVYTGDSASGGIDDPPVDGFFSAEASF